LVDDFIAEIDWQVVIYDTCEANTFVTDVVTRAMAARGIARSPDDRPIDVESYYAFTRPVPDRVV
jgi:hypothetical protein